MEKDIEDIECIMCHQGEYKEKHVTKMFLDKYLIKDFTVYRCKECDHGLVPQEEHQRIFNKIEKLKKSTLHRILNKIKSRLAFPTDIQIL